MSYSDEYYCTNCGATLNDQPGFNPDCGMWTCTECGKLMVGDDLCDDDNSQGVAWICDSCGALLNRQYGFSDSYGSWRCTECGYVNGTTENDILAEKMFECPRCGDVLNNQSCFNRMADDWTCSSCGAHLHHDSNDDDYEQVENPKYICPNCGSALDNQSCFSEYLNDWTCTECGANLHHDYSGDDYEEANSRDEKSDEESKHRCPVCDEILDYQWDYSEDEEDWTCTECGAHLHHEYSDDEYVVVYENDNSNSTSYSNSYNYTEHNEYPEFDDDDIPETDFYGSTSLEGAFTTNDSYHQSSSRQSTNRTQKANTTTRKSNERKNNKTQVIKSFIILVIAVFLGCKLIGAFFQVLIQGKTKDHTGEIQLTDSANSYKGENYYFAIEDLHNQGLKDIRVTPLDDLKTGLSSKDGLIKSVEIDGDSDFESGDWVSENSVVYIYYHSFPKQDKRGYSSEKNSHIFIGGMDIPLPNYLVEDHISDTKAVYHVEDDLDTRFLILNNTKQIHEELNSFDTYYLLSADEHSSPLFYDKCLYILGKQNDEVYSIQIINIEHEEIINYLMVITPNNSKTDYSFDMNFIVSDIYVPKDTEIQIDFTNKDFKGEDYEDVIAYLKSKGFDNIHENNLEDVVLGIFKKEGAVDNITINGETNFKKGDWIDKSSEIVVAYHGK